jgi:hypothetical protein
MARILLALALASFALAQEGPAPLGGSALIDAHMARAWADAGVAAPPACDDLTFLRRATLDITGTVPSLDKIRSFARDASAHKREKLVDDLLASDRYAQHWGRMWSEVLLTMSPGGRREPAAAAAFRAEITARVRRNQAWNELVHDLLTTRGSYSMAPDAKAEDQAPIVAWYQQFDGKQMRASVMAGALSKVFLGVQIQCAECHDHPFDKWTQEDFKGMASFFARWQPVRQRIEEPAMEGMEPDKAKGRKRQELYVYSVRDEDPKAAAARRPARPGAKGQPQDVAVEPRYLDNAAPLPAGVSRRQAFGDLVVKDPQFARAYVNRMWAHFLGRGIVHPYDDFTLRTKPVLPAVLDGLAADFASTGSDPKRLIRAIVLSKAYQAASVGKERDPGAERLFARARVRTLDPDELFNAITDATGSPMGKGNDPDAGRRGFLQSFRGARNETDPAGEAELGVPQALFLMNGPFIENAVRVRNGNALDKIVRSHETLAERVEAIYLAFLCRKPTAAEARKAAAYVEQARTRKTEGAAPAKGDRKRPGAGPVNAEVAGYEDLAWALLNSTEFMTKH